MESNSTPVSKVRYKDYGILILRLGVGIMLLLQSVYALLGHTANLHILQNSNDSDLQGIVWLNSVLLLLIIIGTLAYIVGYFTRLVAALLALIFFVTSALQLGAGGSFMDFANNFNISIVFFASIYLGGGKLSIDYKTNNYKINLESSGAL